MKILGTGITGLVGSRVVDLLGDRHEFESIGRSTGVDITDREQVRAAINKSPASLVIHMAAKTDVDGCERDKDEDTRILGNDDSAAREALWKLKTTAWSMNVQSSTYVAEACKEAGKRLIYISTDFVFDGEKPEGESYTEEDTPNPQNWYAVTKYEGEKAIQAVDDQVLILRLAYPYRSPFPAKNDFVQAILSRLKKGENVMAITDHIMSPTLVDDLAFALDMLIRRNATGIYHVVGSSSITPYDAAMQIAKTYGILDARVEKTTRQEFFLDRAFRPFNLSLSNDKIKNLGVMMHTFEEGLREITKQIANF